MRKITEKLIEEFQHGDREFTKLSRRDAVCNDVVYLWNSPIVKRQDNKIVLSDCGYSTATTAERLRGFLAALNCRYNGHPVVYRFGNKRGFYADGVKLVEGKAEFTIDGEFIA